MTRLLLAVLAAAAALAGCGSTAEQQAPGPASAPSSAPAAPTRVVIPAIGAESTLIRTGMLPTGAPEIPDVHTPGQASWATWSPEPGTPGPATLYGHVNGEVNGQKGVPGVFARLTELRTGDEVLVDRADGSRVRFEVYAVRAFPKADMDEQAVYGDTAGPEARLVTCGGAFDPAARSYVDQIVVFARAAP